VFYLPRGLTKASWVCLSNTAEPVACRVAYAPHIARHPCVFMSYSTSDSYLNPRS
jgi:hypothetical protein